MGEWIKNGSKTGFFNLLENFVNFYWFFYVMEICIICCVPAQIPYLEKFWFLRCGAKCSQPVRLQDLLINQYLQNRSVKWPGLLDAGRNSHKLIISWSKNFWVGMVINGCGQSGHGTLKLTLSQEWNDEVN